MHKWTLTYKLVSRIRPAGLYRFSSSFLPLSSRHSLSLWSISEYQFCKRCTDSSCPYRSIPSPFGRCRIQLVSRHVVELVAELWLFKRPKLVLFKFFLNTSFKQLNRFKYLVCGVSYGFVDNKFVCWQVLQLQ